MNQIPVVLVVLAIAVLLFGLLPRTIPPTWAIMGYGMIVGTFGQLLDLPSAAFNLAPYEHLPELPLEAFSATPFIVLLAIVGVAAAIGMAAFRRRNLTLT